MGQVQCSCFLASPSSACFESSPSLNGHDLSPSSAGYEFESESMCYNYGLLESELAFFQFFCALELQIFSSNRTPSMPCFSVFIFSCDGPWTRKRSKFRRLFVFLAF